MRTVKFRGKVDGAWWYFVASDANEGEWSQFWGLVERKTVGQWIGLLDVNGKEVYEGDILSGQLYRYGYELNGWNKAFTGVVQWVQRDQLCGFCLIDKEENYLELLYATHRNEDFNGETLLLEIIGNIHDNPELVERGERYVG
jgi:uncharacterized phage protein (TIGR01671 family)